ncbi:Lrp/AsnC family transcriptional regulator [Leeia sp. TBRC 13508]|uniref:Lrp/AsnC family transcriptional regulator n=1 Tax=Leeia speluncae TaxID=2884804 RepID=A0ABS8DB71_9NEIS|nr:Lrp/AsnC family transcriptional regulator [Leeia speluncae]MCB6184863.1 Lrp/AsnC family transcriptional regulator [Leeia speluncae]
MNALDVIDLKILALLQEDGRMSNQLLAEKVALSPSACLRRVRLLEEAGAIAGYRAILDASRLGLELESIVQVSMRQDVEGWHEHFSEAIRNWPEVTAAYVVTGEANYILRVRAKNLHEYSEFVINQLYKTKGVQDIRSNIIMQRLKEEEGKIPPDLLALSQKRTSSN